MTLPASPAAATLRARSRLERAAQLDTRTWPTAGAGTVVVPLGSLEQHGPHLPLGSDAWVAGNVAAELVAGEGERATLAPPIPYGASGEHEGFPGTISIGTAALEAVLAEFGRSATRWADRVLFVNGHGGNVDALSTSIPLLRADGHDVAWVSCEGTTEGADPHAGRTETSLLLAIDSLSVRESLAVAGDTRPLQELMPELRAHGVRQVSPNGVLGDPDGASTAEGRRLLDTICADVRARFRHWRVEADGRLGAVDAREAGSPSLAASGREAA